MKMKVDNLPLYVRAVLPVNLDPVLFGVPPMFRSMAPKLGPIEACVVEVRGVPAEAVTVV